MQAYPDISFNISHSGNLAAVIIQFPDETDKGMDSACGIDIEQIKPGRNKIAERFFFLRKKKQNIKGAACKGSRNLFCKDVDAQRSVGEMYRKRS